MRPFPTSQYLLSSKLHLSLELAVTDVCLLDTQGPVSCSGPLNRPSLSSKIPGHDLSSLRISFRDKGSSLFLLLDNRNHLDRRICCWEDELGFVVATYKGKQNPRGTYRRTHTDMLHSYYKARQKSRILYMIRSTRHASIDEISSRIRHSSSVCYSGERSFVT